MLFRCLKGIQPVDKSRLVQIVILLFRGRSPMKVSRVVWVTFAAFLFGLVAPAKADSLYLTSTDIPTDPVASTITFALTFSGIPALQTYDPFVRAENEFSIDILTNSTGKQRLFGFGNEDVRILSSEYRVEDALHPSVAPFYGRVATPTGDSAITTPRYSGSLLLDLIPFEQDGPVVSVTANFSQLQLQQNGTFEAYISTYTYGAECGPSADAIVTLSNGQNSATSRRSLDWIGSSWRADLRCRFEEVATPGRHIRVTPVATEVLGRKPDRFLP